MNRQEIYNKIKAALLHQNAKSENSYGCRYRGPKGLKCAIGHLIPDHIYKPSMEGLTIALICKGKLKKYLKCKTKVDITFLRDLQSVHDRYPIEQWKDQLTFIAESYELVP